eukprot:5244765-Amphidinium_carterae.1
MMRFIAIADFDMLRTSPGLQDRIAWEKSDFVESTLGSGALTEKGFGFPPPHAMAYAVDHQMQLHWNGACPENLDVDKSLCLPF